MTPKTRSRLVLLLIFAMFFVSFGVAFFLRMSGWEPEVTRNAGELLDPVIDLRDLTLRHADGEPYPWQPERRLWRVVAVAPTDCDASCTQMIDLLRRVWIGEGRHAERVHVLWFGEIPADAPIFRALYPMQRDRELLARLPDASAPGAIPVYLVDPSGFLVMRYTPGFDPGGLRRDLARLLK
ncbi:hypothetical protein [Rehaibacterium terrae]|jgi:hypothetical protein|uniref:Thioredoxin domain-containing protein n=1 Tax=Rehaibacterium terrae TaxID=1341696 RepID=A0A7W7XYF8_9GAMM|nr:hypothetical protein [Rehaibacterium terrae]MBB5014662.1 hypothetical protein [Rehaibacterium terrae]